MGLPSIGQSPEENRYDYFDASNTVVRINVGFRACFTVRVSPRVYGYIRLIHEFPILER